MTLDEMEALEKAATPGPWITDYAVHIGTGIETLAIYHWPTEVHCVEIIESPDEMYSECIHNEGDWKFIAASREFVPWAIKRIRTLERAYQGMKDAHSLLKEYIEDSREEKE